MMFLFDFIEDKIIVLTVHDKKVRLIMLLKTVLKFKWFIKISCMICFNVLAKNLAIYEFKFITEF